jgi:hypothetical protein
LVILPCYLGWLYRNRTHKETTQMRAYYLMREAQFNRLANDAVNVVIADKYVAMARHHRKKAANAFF